MNLIVETNLKVRKVLYLLLFSSTVFVLLGVTFILGGILGINFFLISDFLLNESELGISFVFLGLILFSYLLKRKYHKIYKDALENICKNIGLQNDYSYENLMNRKNLLSARLKEIKKQRSYAIDQSMNDGFENMIDETLNEYKAIEKNAPVLLNHQTVFFLFRAFFMIMIFAFVFSSVFLAINLR